MDTNSLSSCQVWWAQELFWYHFQNDYCQKKTNGATNILFRFSKKNQAEDDGL